MALPSEAETNSTRSIMLKRKKKISQALCIQSVDSSAYEYDARASVANQMCSTTVLLSLWATVMFLLFSE